ncbi:MAG TPA: DUF2059 domain-containing protein [Bauldia sp.]|nr:DUF2059 domain-containing protein [Bauldia sp.]
MIVSRTRIALAALAMAFSLGGQAIAQEVSQSHLDAALEAVKSAGAARGFDSVLPALADRVKSRLIRVRPDLHQEISAIVEQVALQLTTRRADLDQAVAKVWAKNFTEDELVTIAEFYRSPTGQKFAEIGPRVIQDSLRAVEAWSTRVGEELYEMSREELTKQGFEF